jgi:putative PIN family toxin of toxin-antitoxin system
MTAPAPPRAVIDTNVLLDFWVFEDPGAAPLRAAVEGHRVHVLRSDACVDEFSDVLDRPALNVAATARCEILRHWHALATPVARVFSAPFACTDPHDQKFLDLAHTARADWLVTKDKALLGLARRAQRAGLRIVEPIATSLLLAARS